MTGTALGHQALDTPLVAVAHGSRDPRSTAMVARLLDVVRTLRPGLDVRPAFLDLSQPRLLEALAQVRDDGYRQAVVVPLLLGSAFHARVDVPELTTAAIRRVPGLRVSVAHVLGPHRLLESAALRRLRAAGADPADRQLGVVLAGAGSAHGPANAAVRAVAGRWAATTRWAGVTVAFATAAEPDVASAIASLRARGARRVAVGSWFLAPGLLAARVARQALAVEPDALLAAELGDDPGVANVVLDRYLGGLDAAGPRRRTGARPLAPVGAA